MKRLVGVFTLLVLAICATTVSAQQGQQQTSFEVKSATGQVVGTVTMVQTGQGVNIKGTFNNLPPGPHGIHIHAVGACTPDFNAAGGHFNPGGKQHGLENSQGAHAGDLANLTINPDGTGTYDHTTQLVTLGPGATSVFDADGSSLIIHANADDYKTDPTGNSGGRIACGVLQAAQAGGAGAQPAAGTPATPPPAPAALPDTSGDKLGLAAIIAAALVALAGGALVVRRSHFSR